MACPGRLRLGRPLLLLCSLIVVFRITQFQSRSREDVEQLLDRRARQKNRAAFKRIESRQQRTSSMIRKQQEQNHLPASENQRSPVKRVQRFDISGLQAMRERHRQQFPKVDGRGSIHRQRYPAAPGGNNHVIRSNIDNTTDWLTNEGKLRAVGHRPPQKGSGYAPSGGEVPEDQNRLHPEHEWEMLDNHTCLHQSTEPVYEWQTRAPYAILLGAMKAGTQALTHYLWQHPNISQGGLEKHFFNAADFVTSAQGISQALNQKAYAQRFLKSHRDLFLAETTDDKRNHQNRIARGGRNQIAMRSDPFKYALDSTPYYLLASDRMPASILCVAPWAKLIAILRDPLERAASHYRYLNEARERNAKPMVDWEVWVEHDLSLLRQAGVVQDWNVVDFDSFAGSPEELVAWKRYLRSPNSQQLLGRGLYAIQVGHYLAALEEAGRPKSDLHVIHSEALRENTQKVYDELLEFLELPLHALKDASVKHQTLDKGQKMPDHVRQQLELFFAPYNQRLYQLLGWPEVWPPRSSVPG